MTMLIRWQVLVLLTVSRAAQVARRGRSGGAWPGQGLGEYALITVLMAAIAFAGLLLLAAALHDDLVAWATRWPVRRPT